MCLSELFLDYKTDIEEVFASIVSEYELESDTAPCLEFTSTETSMLFRCVPSKLKVLIDWRGLASLWAMSQAIGRLSPAIFRARRDGAERLYLLEDSEEELGHQFIGYSKELCIPQTWRWNAYFPMPDRRNPSEASLTGDKFFLLSIEWVLRHELGHIVFGHSDLALTSEQSREEEKEADLNATCAIKGNFVTDPNRDLGAKPSNTELELERRALAAGVALIWVGMYEDTRTQSNELYPALADRMFRCLDQFSLAVDSAAYEILSDFIKSWIDPEGNWSNGQFGKENAQAAMDEACSRLDEYSRNIKR